MGRVQANALMNSCCRLFHNNNGWDFVLKYEYTSIQVLFFFAMIEVVILQQEAREDGAKRKVGGEG